MYWAIRSVAGNATRDWLFLLLVPVCAPLSAQTGAGNRTADDLLAKAVAYAERYRSMLPSLVCDEAIVSAEVKNGAVKKQTTVHGTMREVRTDGGKEPFEEKHSFTVIDGVPAAEVKKYHLPYFVFGGFANGLAFLAPDRVKCYTATIEPIEDQSKIRISLVSRPEMGSAPECEGAANVTSRFVVLDRSSGHVLHSERTLRPEYAKKAKDTYFASVDYGPVQLGGEAVWVPLKVIAFDPKQEGCFEASYSNFHRFTGTVTIVSDTEKPSTE